MMYRLRHKKTGLFYRSQTSRNGITTNLHSDGHKYSFRPTAEGRGRAYRDLKGNQLPMQDSEWEAVEWKPLTLEEAIDRGFGQESPPALRCPHCQKII